jgi:hypothetical protein
VKPTATPVPPTPGPTVKPTATPVPPTPSPSSPAGGPAIAQISAPARYSSASSLSATLPGAPRSGDLLVAVVDSWNPPSAPAGFTQKDGPGDADFSVFTGVVGKNGLAASQSYSFGSDVGIVQIVDVSGASQSSAPVFASDPMQWTNAFPRSLTVPAKGGLLLSTWGAYTNSSSGLQSIGEQLPSGQSEKTLGQAYNDPINAPGESGGYSLKVSQLTSEAYNAAQPFTDIGTIQQSGGYDLNGELIWIPAAN